MNESQAIGIRVDSSMLRKIDDVGKVEKTDRSTAIRMLLEEGYRSFLQRKAAEMYKSGKITFSKAAMDADLTLWEMEQYLVRHGFKSQYSVEDLQRELEQFPSKTTHKSR